MRNDVSKTNTDIKTKLRKVNIAVTFVRLIYVVIVLLISFVFLGIFVYAIKTGLGALFAAFIDGLRK